MGIMLVRMLDAAQNWGSLCTVFEYTSLSELPFFGLTLVWLPHVALEKIAKLFNFYIALTVNMPFLLLYSTN